MSSDNSKIISKILECVKKIRNNPKSIEFSKMENGLDYSSPLQIDVFWMIEPQIQTILFRHDDTKTDLEINIHGPFQYSDFFSNVLKILETDYNSEVVKYGKKISLNHILAYELYRSVYTEIHQINQPSFHDYTLQEAFVDTNDKFEQGWISIIHNDISKINIDSMISHFENHVDNMSFQIQGTSKQIAQQQGQKIGYGSHIFPPVIIGEKITPILKDIITGKQPSPDIVFVKKFTNCSIVLNNDGMIAIEIPDQTESLQLLNAIMGMLVLHNVDARPVRLNDLYGIVFDPANSKIIGMSYNPTKTIRGTILTKMRQVDLYSNVKKQLNSEIVEKSIDLVFAEKDEHINQDLVFLSEAHSHLQEHVYSQSFVLSWLIIERYLYRLWQKWWDGKLAQDEKIPSMQADRLIQFLRSSGTLSILDSQLFGVLRDIRNSFVHGGKQIQEDSAKNCYDKAKLIIKNELNI